MTVSSSNSFLIGTYVKIEGIKRFAFYHGKDTATKVGLACNHHSNPRVRSDSIIDPSRTAPH